MDAVSVFVYSGRVSVRSVLWFADNEFVVRIVVDSVECMDGHATVVIFVKNKTIIFQHENVRGSIDTGGRRNN